MKYNLNYFIHKFEKIPSCNWTKWNLSNENGQHCVLGHCGVTVKADDNYNHTNESIALATILDMKPDDLWKINDRGTNHPKDNILNALYEKKNKTLNKK